MFLIVGLGNPGPAYDKHRHNIGFRVIDALRARWSLGAVRNEFNAQFVKGEWQGHPVALLKPQTFMNRSGESAQQAMRFFKINTDSMLCVHDELDLPFGVLRLKIGGGSAGHNGIKSMALHCGDSFLRLRVGIGKPLHGEKENYVLSAFNTEESLALSSIISRSIEFIEATVTEGPPAAMNKFHTDPIS